MKHLLILSTFLSSLSFGQSDTLLLSKERELSTYLTELRNANTDKEKEELNDDFKIRMKQFLERDGAIDHKFTLLPSIGVIDSPDGVVRIVNWNVEKEDLTNSYYCFILQKDKRKRTKITEFIDAPMMNQQKPETPVNARTWYGALYYKIIPVKRSGKTLYTLLGWDGNTSISNMKVIDVLSFSGTTAKLGYPLFKISGETKKRVFYEFSEKTTMYLHYEEERERIMMDHLSPESPSMRGFYEFYVPDLSYDALEYDGKFWVLKEDVIGVNKAETDSQEIYTMDANGNLVKVDVDNEWVDPTNKEAPAGGNIHVAITPDDVDKENKKKNKENKDDQIKDKRDPSNLNQVTGGNKRKNRRKRNKSN